MLLSVLFRKHIPKKTNSLKAWVSNPWPARVYDAVSDDICKLRTYHTNYTIIKAAEYTVYYFVTCGPRTSPFAEKKSLGTHDLNIRSDSLYLNKIVAKSVYKNTEIIRDTSISQLLEVNQ